MKSMKRGLISLLALIMVLLPLADETTYGSDSGSDVPPLPITDVYASMSDENLPENAIDGDLSTRWSAFGEGQWITFDLGSIRTIGYLGISFYRGDQRRTVFDIQVSADGSAWTTVYQGEGSGETILLEPFGFDPVDARFVRVVGYGAWTSETVKTEWTSLNEVQVYEPHPEGFVLSPLQPPPVGPDPDAEPFTKAGLFNPDGSPHMIHEPDEVTGQTLNVADFGATPENNGEDDAPAIRAALEAAVPGDEVYFPAGHYQLSSTSSDRTSHLQLRSGIQLRGESKENVVLVSDHANAYGEHAQSEGIVFRIAGQNNIKISSMTITSSWDLQYPTSTTTANEFRGGPKTSIMISSASGKASYNIFMDRLKIEKFQRAGVLIRSSRDVVVQNSMFQNATDISGGGAGYGVLIEGKPQESRLGREDDSYFNVVRNSEFIGPYLRHGVIMQYWTHNNLVENNHFEHIVLDAIDLHGEDEYLNEITGNYMKGGGEAGVGVGNTGASHDASGPGNYIHHNVFDNMNRYGIQVYLGSPDTVIENNRFIQFSKADSHAIRLKNAPGTIVKGNVIENNTAVNFWGIRVIYDIGDPGNGGRGSGEPRDILIQSNTITGNTNGVEIASGTKIVLAGNDISGNMETDYVNRVAVLQELQASADVSVQKNADSNSGTATSLVVKGGNDNSTRRTYMKYDLSEVNGSLATAWLYVYGRATESPSSNPEVPNAIHAVENDDWKEAGMLWNASVNNMPALGDELTTVPVRKDTVDSWYKIDVTLFVQQQLDQDPSKLVSLGIIQDPLKTGYFTRFNSREHSSNRPYLRIETYPEPELDRVMVTAEQNVLGLGDTVQLHVTGMMNTGSSAPMENAAVAYESSTPELASVNDSGVVTALAEGFAQVKAEVALNGTVRSDTIELQIVDGIVTVLTPTDDAYVRGGTYEQTNYKTHGIDVKRDNSLSNAREGYLKFDLSSIRGVVVSSKLFLYGRVNPASSDPSIHLYLSGTDWSEDTLAWSNKPEQLDYMTSALFHTDHGWIEADLPGAAVQEFNGQSLSLAMKGANFNDYFVIDSKEKTNAPYLLIVSEIDDIPPHTGNNAPSDWIHEDWTLTLTAEDDLSGVSHTLYSVNDGEWTEGTSVDITQEEINTIRYYSVDKAGNEEEIKSVTVKLDKTAPDIGFSGAKLTYSVDESVDITCHVSDQHSGVASSSCPDIHGDAYTFNLGENVYIASAVDAAGNAIEAEVKFSVIVEYDGLRKLTERFVEQSELAASLVKQLDAAEASHESGNVEARNKQLEAYISEVSAQSGKAIAEKNADVLIRLAQHLSNQL